MRRLPVLLGTIALALAGCGDDGGGEAGSPLDEALGYLPEEAPLVVTIDTDVDGEQFKALEAIADKFPFGEQLRDSLLEELELGGGDFEDDIEPILGNEFVVGATDVSALIDGSEDDNFVAAIEAGDKDALEKAVGREGAEETGEKNGATVYEDDDGDAFAIEDDVLVVAGSSDLLDAALEQRDADDRLTEDTFNEGLEGLPDDALLKVYGDIGALIEGDPDAEQARRSEWVAALTTLGMTAGVQEDEVAIDFNLATDGDLSDEDLPLAAGTESPGTVQREGEIGLGLRDLNQIFEFTVATAEAIDPDTAADIATAEKQFQEQLGFSITDDFFGQLAGDSSISYALDGSFGSRSELEDPDAFAETLEKAAPSIPELFEGELGGSGPVRLQKPRGADGLYRVEQAGATPVVFGVLNDVFVTSNNEQRARTLAQSEPEQVEGAEGSLVFRMNAQELTNSVLSQLGGLEALGGQLLTGPLGDLTGSMESSPEGLSGNFTLGID